MAVAAIEASQGYQTMAKTLNYLTYRTLSDPKTHKIFETIMIFTQKRKVTGGRQTIVTKSFISNDKGALDHWFSFIAQVYQGSSKLR